MLNAILFWMRFVILVLGGHQQVALENAALRQQLAVFKRDVKRPQLRRWDRLFWIGLRAIWKDWKSALVIVRPETVISWQYAPALARPYRPLSTNAAIQTGTRR